MVEPYDSLRLAFVKVPTRLLPLMSAAIWALPVAYGFWDMIPRMSHYTGVWWYVFVLAIASIIPGFGYAFSGPIKGIYSEYRERREVAKQYAFLKSFGKKGSSAIDKVVRAHRTELALTGDIGRADKRALLVAALHTGVPMAELAMKLGKVLKAPEEIHGGLTFLWNLFGKRT